MIYRSVLESAAGKLSTGGKTPECLALLEVDFTTEGKQLNRGSGLAHRTCKGTPGFHKEGRVLGLEGKVILDFTLFGTRGHVDRSIRGSSSFDITGVAGQVVIPAPAEIAVIAYLAAVGVYLHQGPIDGVQHYIAAHRGDFNVSVANVSQGDRAIECLDMHMTGADIADIDI